LGARRFAQAANAPPKVNLPNRVEIHFGHVFSGSVHGDGSVEHRVATASHIATIADLREKRSPGGNGDVSGLLNTRHGLLEIVVVGQRGTDQLL
jgi:hypothetical protein